MVAPLDVVNFLIVIIFTEFIAECYGLTVESANFKYKKPAMVPFL